VTGASGPSGPQGLDGLDGATGPTGPGSQVYRSIHQVGHGFAVGDVVRLNGTATYTKAQADSVPNAEAVGIVIQVLGANDFVIATNGYITGLSGLTANTVYFLSPSVAGALTATEPSTDGQVDKPLFIADTTTSGYLFNFRGEELVAAGADEGLPWMIDINPIIPPPTITGWNNFSGPLSPYGYLRYTAVQNDEVGWPVNLDVGSYELQVIGNTRTDNGIATVTFGATTIATIDGYSASPTDPFVYTNVPFVIAAASEATLKFKTATKNASSAGFNFALYWVRIIRTA